MTAARKGYMTGQSTTKQESRMTQPAEDGNLPETLRKLGEAISALIDPKPQTHEGNIHWTDSLYSQLLDACPGDQGQSHSLHAGSIVPFWVDAVDLKQRIDATITTWDTTQTGTTNRLKAIEIRAWRPQDCTLIEQFIGDLQAWVSSIKALLTPAPKWSLPNPCPACDTAVVYRKDSAGDTVRQPALQIGPNGCECAKCHHVWAPEYFRHLASVLGYKLPEGVLE